MKIEKVDKYVCEYCGREYMDRKECEECEERCSKKGVYTLAELLVRPDGVRYSFDRIPCADMGEVDCDSFICTAGDTGMCVAFRIYRKEIEDTRPVKLKLLAVAREWLCRQSELVEKELEALNEDKD